MSKSLFRTGGFAALALLAALAGCARSDHAPAGKPPAADKAVASVDGQTIYAADVRREAVAQGLIAKDERLDPASDLFRQVLDELVDQKLLAGEAVRRKLDQDPDAQRRLAAARERILADQLVQGVIDKAVTDQAVQALYEQQVRQAAGGDEVQARQIVTRTQPDADAVRRQLAAGASFDALAAQRSIDAATRFKGGDLGWFALDVMPQAYGAALKSARAGDIVGPFPVEAGFALVRLDARRPKRPIPLSEARPQIVRFLTYDQVRALVAQLRGKAKVQLLAPAAPRPAGASPEPSSAPPSAKPEVRP